MAAKADDAQTKEVAKFLRDITPFIEVVAPKIIEYKKTQEPIIKRWQIINFTIMMTILLSVGFLAWNKMIDGSAVTGLFGAVIGYVFGAIYQQKASR